MRKSHSTAANLSDIAKLNISSSQQPSNVNVHRLIPTSNTLNNISEHDSHSHSHHHHQQYTNGNHIKTNRTFKPTDDGINYHNNHIKSNINPLNNSKNNHHRPDSEYLIHDTNVMTSVTAEEVNESPHAKYTIPYNGHSNNYQNQHQHPYYHYNDASCFSAIQEEKMPTGFVEDNHGQTHVNIITNGTSNNNTNTNSCLKIQNEMTLQPSSSSSNSSLNNNSRAVTNSNNTNGNKSMLNYGSSISNTTTGMLKMNRFKKKKERKKEVVKQTCDWIETDAHKV